MVPSATSAGCARRRWRSRTPGASYFLVPLDQVEEAELEAKGSSLKVIGVHTVDEALTVLAGLGGDISGIPAPPAA